jgi:hypothetical protein
MVGTRGVRDLSNAPVDLQQDLISVRAPPGALSAAPPPPPPAASDHRLSSGDMDRAGSWAGGRPAASARLEADDRDGASRDATRRAPLGSMPAAAPPGGGATEAALRSWQPAAVGGGGGVARWELSSVPVLS